MPEVIQGVMGLILALVVWRLLPWSVQRERPAERVRARRAAIVFLWIFVVASLFFLTVGIVRMTSN